ncbi:MAG TPA: hypothetical protein VGE93_21415, partial [Bryobacteraceae bacterium]
MVRYLKVAWHHDFAEDPVEIFSEVGDDDYEVRKVELFHDGRFECSMRSAKSGPRVSAKCRS